MPREKPVIIVGGGFGGMAAAHELALHGRPSIILEASAQLGGLAGTFDVNGHRLEKFYHHWFTHDQAILDLVAELGATDQLVYSPGDVSMYYANSVYRLRGPLDLLRLGALPFIDRIRTGLMALRARRVRDWHSLEQQTAVEWLVKYGGRRAYEVIWEPLLRGKFGSFTDEISAVWISNKLKLRGSSRSRSGRNELLYYRGGFGALIDRLTESLRNRGVEIRTACPVSRVATDKQRVIGVETAQGMLEAETILVTTSLPVALDLIPDLPAAYRNGAASIRHLGSVCLILVLRNSLSSAYWMNVNDPSFPFVAVIEHTQFDSPDNYDGAHVVYLSRYTTPDDPMFLMDEAALVNFCTPYLQRIFPQFEKSWILQSYCWKAKHTQPIVSRGYSKLIPNFQTPIAGLWLCTMAQIYPEDRGTNYAVAYARRTARRILSVERPYPPQRDRRPDG